MRPRTEENLGFEAILPARSQYGLRFNSLSNQTGLYSSLGGFSGELMTALAKVPQWMRADLQNTHLMLTDAKRGFLRQSDAEARRTPVSMRLPFAHCASSPEYLNSDLAHPQLFVKMPATSTASSKTFQYMRLRHCTHEANPIIKHYSIKGSMPMESWKRSKCLMRSIIGTSCIPDCQTR
jgi:hypothetical protein